MIPFIARPLPESLKPLVLPCADLTSSTEGPLRHSVGGEANLDSSLQQGSRPRACKSEQGRRNSNTVVRFSRIVRDKGVCFFRSRASVDTPNPRTSTSTHLSQPATAAT